MERKLVQHGESTLMVSLPKKWTKSQNLNKGDSVDISAFPGKLIISKNKIKTKERAEKIILNTSSYETARTILGELYRRGIDRIEIEFKDSKTIYYIQLIVKSMAGFEIITQKDFSCVLKRLLKETEINLDEIQNKMTNIIKAESIMIKEYLVVGNKNKEDEIRSLRDDCWKLRNLAYLDLKENIISLSYDDYFNIHIMEHNSTYLFWLYRSFCSSKTKKVSKEFLELYDQIYDYFKKSVSKKDDREYIEYIMKNRKLLLSKCENYAKKEDYFLVLYLGMLVQNIHNPKSLLS